MNRTELKNIWASHLDGISFLLFPAQTNHYSRYVSQKNKNLLNTAENLFSQHETSAELKSIVLHKRRKGRFALYLYYKPQQLSSPLFFTCIISQNPHKEKRINFNIYQCFAVGFLYVLSNKPSFLTSLSKRKYVSRIS